MFAPNGTQAWGGLRQKGEVSYLGAPSDAQQAVLKRELYVPGPVPKMTTSYLFDALKKLRVTGIDRMPKATEHIAEMIGIMRGLIDKGHAYAAGGDVYFDVTRDPDYGKLCNRDPEQLEAGRASR